MMSILKELDGRSGNLMRAGAGIAQMIINGVATRTIQERLDTLNNKES